MDWYQSEELDWKTNEQGMPALTQQTGSMRRQDDSYVCAVLR